MSSPGTEAAIRMMRPGAPRSHPQHAFARHFMSISSVRSRKPSTAIATAIASAIASINAAHAQVAGDDHVALRDLVVTVPEEPRIATIYSDGERIVVPVESIWRPMCFSQPGAMTKADLLRI